MRVWVCSSKGSVIDVNCNFHVARGDRDAEWCQACGVHSEAQELSAPDKFSLASKHPKTVAEGTL